MQKGVVFDIQEFCMHDGPGPRTTVFLKGCPLRCRWCHNPEGLACRPELMRSAACRHCGACAQAQTLLDAGGDEAAIRRLCPHGALSVAGRIYDASALAKELMRYADSLAQMGGGVTVSGGECLLQSRFTAELLAGLSGVHRAIETAGAVPAEDFLRVLPNVELVLFDVKLMDARAHKRWTGMGNERIQHNLTLLRQSGVPFIARIPLIPGVNDGVENLTATAERLAGAPGLVRVELLPYNTAAGAKYGRLGRAYAPGFCETAAPATVNAAVFQDYAIPCEVL